MQSFFQHKIKYCGGKTVVGGGRIIRSVSYLLIRDHGAQTALVRSRRKMSERTRNFLHLPTGSLNSKAPFW